MADAQARPPQPNALDATPAARTHRARPVDRDRTSEERLADHDRIGRLAEDLLPELASRLAAGNLGEIEIREDGWRLRVRRPAGAPAPAARRTTERTRATPGHAGHATAPASGGHVTADRSSAGASTRGTTAAEPASLNGSGPGAGRLPGTGTGAAGQAGHAGAGSAHLADPASAAPPVGLDEHRVVATSPAVGIFHARPELHAGSRVRGGERIAMVDLLGVPQDVVAPADGVVVSTLADNGDGVEYGQELVVIELVGRFGPARASGPDGQAG